MKLFIGDIICLVFLLEKQAVSLCMSYLDCFNHMLTVLHWRGLPLRLPILCFKNLTSGRGLRMMLECLVDG